MSVTVTSLGFPRIGSRRELKVALESYWSGKSDAVELLKTAAQIRASNWERQKAAGIQHIPSNDFSLYDHVLDTSVMVGAIPPIYGKQKGAVSLDTYFAMARGSQTFSAAGNDACCAGKGQVAKAGVPALLNAIA